jgi:hypothetical protein
VTEDIGVDNYDSTRVRSVANDVGIKTMEWLDSPLWEACMNGTLEFVSVFQRLAAA